MSAPSKVYNIRLVEIQFYDWPPQQERIGWQECDVTLWEQTHTGRVKRVSVHNSHDVEDVLPKSRVREKPEVRFCEVDHNNLGANTLIGGAL